MKLPLASWLASACAVLLCRGVDAIIQAPLPPKIAAVPGSATGNSTFQQLIDHANPESGTFAQWYWWDTSYWKGPGSPVIVFNAGESSAMGYQGYLSNKTMVGRYAKALGGVTIMIEHRFYGNSSPYSLLDNKALQYLTINNSVSDMVNFARNVILTFDTERGSNAPNAPWIQIGGSYSGALAAWNEKLSPGTYWAYHASSAPVEVVYDYWAYFLPIQQGMPKNCSRDMERIVDYIDGVIASGNATELATLQESFGLQDLSHADDFAGALGGPLGDWQGMQMYSNYSVFWQMCDTIEGVRAVSPSGENNATGAIIPSADGVGLANALPNFAAWFKAEFLPGWCANYDYDDWKGNMSVGCFDTYNETSVIYTDLTVSNTINRQWMWFLCNEPMFYWQTGAPKGRPSILSRYVSAEYYQRQCDLFFPQEGNYTFGSKAGKTEGTLNALTEGWNRTNTTRLLWANGEFDPWRTASVSSEFRPGGALQSTANAPVFLMKDARHCNDLIWRSGEVNADMRATQNAQIKQMMQWIGEFYDETGRQPPFGLETRHPRMRTAWSA